MFSLWESRAFLENLLRTGGYCSNPCTAASRQCPDVQPGSPKVHQSRCSITGTPVPALLTRTALPAALCNVGSGGAATHSVDRMVRVCRVGQGRGVFELGVARPRDGPLES
jgi:hypothetical protein